MRDSKYFQTLINPLFAYHSKTCHSSHHHDERPRGSVCFWQHVNDMCGMYAIYFGAHGTPQKKSTHSFACFPLVSTREKENDTAQEHSILAAIHGGAPRLSCHLREKFPH